MQSEKNDSSDCSHQPQHHEHAAGRPAPQSRERVLHVDAKSPRATHKHTILSPSSRSSEMGRRLAQERQKNKILTQQIQTMQERITFLENNHSLKALSLTPPRGKQKNVYLDHIQELQRELKLETERRQEAERKLANCYVQTIAESSNDADGRLEYTTMSMLENEGRDVPSQSQIDQSLQTNIKQTPMVTNLLERAHNLLSSTHNTSSTSDSSAESQQNLLTYDTSYKDKEKQTVTQELMKDFQGLLEGFFIEQQSKNETMTPSSDVIWLFEELEWRFEEIRRGYEDERSQWIESSEHNSSADAPRTSTRDNNMDEWKQCLQGLIEVVDTQSTRVYHATDLELNYTTQTLRNEVKCLRQQLSTLAKEYNKKCLKLKQDMSSMQHNHKEEIDKQSKTIVSLESELIEQNITILQLEQSLDRDKSFIIKERQKFTSSRDNTDARIHYLEEIVRLMKTDKSPTSRGLGWNKDMHNNYSSLMEDNREISEADSNLILSMSQEIEKLSIALQESEEQRAQSIEEFQLEREGHIRQYEQLSCLLTQFLDSSNLDSSGTKA